jgi:hypothetical protein
MTSEGERSGDLTTIIDPAMLQTPSLQAVRAYWEEKREGRAMPCRADIDPLDLKAYLPGIFMIDVLANAADFRFRLLGTAITQHYQRDSTGKTLREVYATAKPALFNWLTSVLTAVVREKRPVFARAPLRAVGKEYVAYESIHLPLSADGEAVTIILGMTHFLARPRRAEARPIKSNRT